MNDKTSPIKREVIHLSDKKGEICRVRPPACPDKMVVPEGKESERFTERSLYIDLCNGLILICSTRHQKQVNLPKKAWLQYAKELNESLVSS